MAGHAHAANLAGRAATDPRGAPIDQENDPKTTEERAGEAEDVIARMTTRALHIAEDFIYATTALLLTLGAFVVLVVAVYHFTKDVSEGAIEAMEVMLDSLLIVFILVELLSAVRTAIAEHKLVAEPFLLVGILAAIKELVVISTFRIEEGEVSDTVMTIGVLGAVVLALSLATLVMRRREREPEETEHAPE